jgi:Response regulator of the LytR/AlgR family
MQKYCCLGGDWLMKIAVVDDEKLWLKKIEKFLFAYYGDKKTSILCYLSGKSFLDANEEFDIVLMDIEMPVMDGFEAIERYKTRFSDTIIIILTTHDDLAKKGFIFEAFRYIDKPSMVSELPEALKSAARKLNSGKTIMLKVIRAREITVKIKNIVYIETIKRNVIVHMGNDAVTCDAAISEMERALADEGFYRVHRSFLINLRCVESFCKTDIKMNNGDMVMLSTRKFTEFKKRLMEYRYYLANG